MLHIIGKLWISWFQRYSPIYHFLIHVMNSMRRQNYCGAFRKNFQRMRLIQRSPSAPFSSLCLFQIPHQFSTDTTLILPTISAHLLCNTIYPLFLLLFTISDMFPHSFHFLSFCTGTNLSYKLVHPFWRYWFVSWSVDMISTFGKLWSISLQNLFDDLQ